MKLGDFTHLATSYHNRTGYSKIVLTNLARYTGAQGDPTFSIVEVGAGTGKLTECLFELELPCIAVEPNDAMRSEGMKYTKRFKVDWRKGTGEETGLPSGSANWILMGSSFHWVERERGLAEFKRVLRPGGYFTALWNPRDIDSSPLHMRIEKIVYDIAPEIKRVSSGSAKYVGDLHRDLVESGLFKDCVFVEANHQQLMTKERYLGAWRSVNDIQAQAGPERFEKMMKAIEAEISDLDEILVPYKTRSWTVQRVD